MKKLIKICTLFLISVNNFVLADEVKSFATPHEQSKYAMELIKKLSQNSNSSAAKNNEAEQNKEGFIARIISAGKRGKFVIVGKITDEHGNLLQDVCVSVAKSSSGLWKSKEERNTYSLSNYFVIFLSECDSVNIHISKEGYIPAAAYYYYGYDRRLFHMSQKNNININGNLIIGNNLLFMMKKKGELLKLRTFKGKISAAKDDTCNDVFLINSWKISPAKETVREPYLHISSNTASEKSNADILELANANPEDGFIVIDFDEKAVTYKNFWNLTGEAPADGYSKKSFKIQQQLGTLTFFYYFINGKYGKGYICRDGRFVLFQNDGKNQDKKRNLWSSYVLL